MNKQILLFLLIWSAFSCKIQNQFTQSNITDMSKSQDKIFLLRTIEKCNIIKGVCPTLEIDKIHNEYAIIHSEDGKQFTIRRIENDPNAISHSVMGENETYVISNTTNPYFKESSIEKTIIPSGIFNRFNIDETLKNKAEDQLIKEYKNHQIYKDTSYHYYIVHNRSNKKTKINNTEISLFTWQDYKNKMISTHISDKLISDTLIISNEVELLKNIETSVNSSYDSNHKHYDCLIPSKLFQNLTNTLGNSLSEHIKFNYIAETIFMDEKMKNFIKTKPELYQDLVKTYITNLHK